MPPALRGVIEGFYGRPWSWDERVDVLSTCASWGMTTYVYAPKDDTKHRDRWRDPYDRDELHGFRNVVERTGLRVGYAISPGLSIDYGSRDDRAALAAKLQPLLDLGIDLVCLALDDIPPRPGLGEDQAELTRWLREELPDGTALVLVPTDYVNTTPNPYLDALTAGVPDDVLIGWTGRGVVNDEISAADATARAAALGGRPPVLWDNFPVNDGMMADRLFLGPLRGRDPGLLDILGGYLANPMVQPRASLLPLASTAAFLRGDDPEEAWREEADRRGWTVFAEACGPGRDDVGWLQAAATCTAAGLEDEAGPWIEQVHREAEVALAARRILDDPAQASLGDVMTLVLTWPHLRRAKVSVLGLRRGFRPRFGQDAEGNWTLLPGALEEDGSLVDDLARRAVGAVTVASG